MRASKSCLRSAVLGLGLGGKHDLAHLALFRLAVVVLVTLVNGLRIGVRHLVGLGEICRRQREQRELAVFGRAEQRLALVVVALQLLRRRRRNVASLRRAQRQILDGARRVAELVDRLQRHVRHRHVAAHALCDLPPQQHVALGAQENRRLHVVKGMVTIPRQELM